LVNDEDMQGLEDEEWRSIFTNTVKISIIIQSIK
jgi:hypothetical protein